MMSHTVAPWFSIRRTALLAITALVAGCGAPATSLSEAEATAGTDPSTASVEGLCAAGAEEGSVALWGPSDVENWTQIHAKFSQSHPGIDFEMLSIGSQEAVQRVITESQGGQTNTDIVAGSLEHLLLLSERELIDEQMDWAELGVEESKIGPAWGVRGYRVPLGLAYNTETTSPDDLPDTYEEVIDEKYRGQVIADPRGFLMGLLAPAWGVEKVVDWAQRFKDAVDPLFVETATPAMLQVAAGDALFALYGRGDSLEEQRARGAPLGIKYMDFIPAADEILSVLANAEHPQAAACLIAWVATPEGEAAVLEHEFKRNDVVPAGAPPEAEVVTVDNPEDAELVQEARDGIVEAYIGG